MRMKTEGRSLVAFGIALMFFWLVFMPSQPGLPQWLWALGKACLLVGGLSWWRLAWHHDYR
jgi:hypothetical protein